MITDSVIEQLRHDLGLSRREYGLLCHLARRAQMPPATRPEAAKGDGPVHPSPVLESLRAKLERSPSRLRIVPDGAGSWMLGQLSAGESAAARLRRRLAVDTVAGRVFMPGVTLWVSAAEARVVGVLAGAGRPLDPVQLATLAQVPGDAISTLLDRLEGELLYAFGGRLELWRDIRGAVGLRILPGGVFVEEAPGRLRLGPLRLDEDSGTVTLGSDAPVLRRALALIFGELMRAEGGVVPRRPGLVKAVSALRGALPAHVKIVAVRERGYRLELELGRAHQFGTVRLDPCLKEAEVNGATIALTGPQTCLLAAVGHHEGEFIGQSPLMRVMASPSHDRFTREVNALQAKLVAADRSIAFVRNPRSGIKLLLQRWISDGLVVLDCLEETAWVDGTRVPLSPTETELLALTIDMKRSLLPVARLTDRPPAGKGWTRARYHVDALGRKLEGSGTRARLVRLRGAGVRLAIDDAKDRLIRDGLTVSRFHMTVETDDVSLTLTLVEVEFMTVLVSGPASADALREAVCWTTAPHTIREHLYRLAGKCRRRFGHRVRITTLPDDRWELIVDPTASLPRDDPPVVTDVFGALIVDRARRTVSLEGVPLVVSALRAELFGRIVAGRGAVVPHSTLMTCRGRRAESLTYTSIMLHVMALRRQLAAKYGARVAIVTVRGVGFRVVLKRAKASTRL